MRRTGHRRRSDREWSDLYILFLAGIYNLIFADISLAGMPIRTLILLLADFSCIAMRLYRREMELPRWKACGMYERTMAALLGAAVFAIVALANSDAFWAGVDFLALLLIGPCIYGRNTFPRDIFGVYSLCSSVICVLLLTNEMTGGLCEPVLALLLRDHAVTAWLVLTIMVDMAAYCFQEKGQIWYGTNILLASFLLAVQKNVYGMAVVALIPLMLPVFCRPSKVLVRRAAQAELIYVFLICNMSLIMGYTPLAGKIVSYDLETSVYMELLLAAMGVWFMTYWNQYVQQAEEDAALPSMRVWCRKAVTVCLICGVGIFVMAAVSQTEEASAWNRAAQLISGDIRENAGWRSGLPGQMGQRFGVWGIMAAGVFYYIAVMRIYDTKHQRVKAHKIYRLIVAVSLLQALVLPQTMATLPIYVVFFFLFMQATLQTAVQSASGRM